VRILIVEDDALLGDGLASGLSSLGFVVDWFQSGEEADRAVVAAPYDAIVLDLGLPDRSGLEMLARWQSRGQTVPVLILTAREAVESRIEGLDAGADDYLVKPFDLDELASRVRALIRRAAGRAEPVIQRGELAINPATREITWQGAPVALSAREYALLAALAERPGLVLSRAQLEEKLWGWNEAVGSNAVEVHIHNVRKKLGDNVIRNVRGLGYMLGAD